MKVMIGLLRKKTLVGKIGIPKLRFLGRIYTHGEGLLERFWFLPIAVVVRRYHVLRCGLMTFPLIPIPAHLICVYLTGIVSLPTDTACGSKY